MEKATTSLELTA